MFKQKKDKKETSVMKVSTESKDMLDCIDTNNPTMKMEEDAIFGGKPIKNESLRMDMMRAPRCPIFYDESGQIMNIPSPHDIAIERVRHTLLEMEKFVIPNTPKADLNKICDFGGMKSDVSKICTSAYQDAMMSAIVSYLNDRLMYNYSYDMNGETAYIAGIQRVIAETLYSNKYAVDFAIVNAINDFMILISSDLHGSEDYAKIMFGITESATNKIISTVASSLNNLNMCLSFDKSVERDSYAILRINSKKDYLKDLSESEYGGKEISSQLFYFLNSCEFATHLYSMVGMVNALIYQAYSTLVYIINASPSLLNYMQDEYKRYDGCMIDPNFC